MPCLAHSHKRGLSLIELLVSISIVATISALSFSQLRHFKQKSMRSELKIQLSLYYKGYMKHYFEYNKKPSSIASFVFPLGYQNYNIGFSGADTYTLCGTSLEGTLSGPREPCLFYCKPGGNLPSINLTTPIADKTDKIGYAVGNILNVKDCSSADKLDEWSVDTEGTLDHTKDALN